MVVENLDLPSLGTEMGGSALIGAVIGFAAKKIAKILAIIVGAELVVLKFLESRGVLQVDWGRLVNTSERAADQGQAATQTIVETFVSTAGIGAAFAGGFLLGFKRA